MARQFAELAAAEHDRTRLARYEKDVQAMAPLLLKRCGPDTAAKLESAMTDSFLLGPNRTEGAP
jgi:hypothetical protein